MMKFKAIIFSVGLCLSGVGYTQTHSDYSDEERQTAMKQMATLIQVRNEAQRSRINAEKETVRKSTSGLDKQKQIVELSETILYMYGGEKLTNFVNSKFSFKPIKPEYKTKVACFTNSLSYPNYKKFVVKISIDYVLNHPTDLVSEQLTLLINSELSEEIHQVFSSLWTAKDKSAETTAFNVFKLHLLQNPNLNYAVQEISQNPKHSDFKALLGLENEWEKTPFKILMQENLSKCGLK